MTAPRKAWFSQNVYPKRGACFVLQIVKTRKQRPKDYSKYLFGKIVSAFCSAGRFVHCKNRPQINAGPRRMLCVRSQESGHAPPRTNFDVGWCSMISVAIIDSTSPKSYSTPVHFCILEVAEFCLFNEDFGRKYTWSCGIWSFKWISFNWSF